MTMAVDSFLTVLGIYGNLIEIPFIRENQPLCGFSF